MFKEKLFSKITRDPRVRNIYTLGKLIQLNIMEPFETIFKRKLNGMNNPHDIVSNENTLNIQLI